MSPKIRIWSASLLFTTILIVGLGIFTHRDKLTERFRPVIRVATLECKGLLQDYLNAGHIGDQQAMAQIGTHYLEEQCRVGSLVSAMHFLKSQSGVSVGSI
jgi:hypothetical protein